MWTFIVSSSDSCNTLILLNFTLFVAKMTTGAVSDSKALFKNEKHSISNIWTSSINKTPGTISAFPSSLQSATF